jgi:hypothetical protein
MFAVLVLLEPDEAMAQVIKPSAESLNNLLPNLI